MALTALQQDILVAIARNRSETSYIAGGVALNREWSRISDDIDIFQDTDEEIGDIAETDIRTLEDEGFFVSRLINVYGCIEVGVIRAGEQTLVQWMSESRFRFFPLVRDQEWGARLHTADLAINKVLAASTRRQPRDFVDLLNISRHLSSLGPLIMAAAGKPPHYSPVRAVEEIRRRAFSFMDEELLTVRGLPSDWTASFIRQELQAAIEQAEAYVRNAPAELAGVLAHDGRGRPVEVRNLFEDGVEYRRATLEHDAMPDLPEVSPRW